MTTRNSNKQKASEDMAQLIQAGFALMIAGAGIYILVIAIIYLVSLGLVLIGGFLGTCMCIGLFWRVKAGFVRLSQRQENIAIMAQLRNG